MSEGIPHIDLYRHYHQLTPIPVEEWKSLMKFSSEIKLKKKELLVRPGMLVDHYYVVLDGFLRMFYTDKKGNEYTKAFRDKFSLSSPYGELLQAIPSRLSISAIEESTVLQIPYRKMLEAARSHTCWEKLSLATLKQIFLAKEKREYELLALDAKERYNEFVKEYPNFVDRIPQKQIASYIGITPVSLSRLLSNKDSE
jgi:CRP-like cAMP-binding protein